MTTDLVTIQIGYCPFLDAMNTGHPEDGVHQPRLESIGHCQSRAKGRKVPVTAKAGWTLAPYLYCWRHGWPIGFLD